MGEVKRMDYVPAGWRFLKGATNGPKFWRWICNNKSRFSKEYRHALVPEELFYEKEGRS